MPRDGRPTELPLAIAKASRGSELTKLWIVAELPAAQS